MSAPICSGGSRGQLKNLAGSTLTVWIQPMHMTTIPWKQWGCTIAGMNINQLGIKERKRVIPTGNLELQWTCHKQTVRFKKNRLGKGGNGEWRNRSFGGAIYMRRRISTTNLGPTLKFKVLRKTVTGNWVVWGNTTYINMPSPDL